VTTVEVRATERQRAVAADIPGFRKEAPRRGDQVEWYDAPLPRLSTPTAAKPAVPRERRSIREVAAALALAPEKRKALVGLYDAALYEVVALLADDEPPGEVLAKLDRTRPDGPKPEDLEKYVKRLRDRIAEHAAIHKRLREAVRDLIGAQGLQDMEERFIVEEADPLGLAHPEDPAIYSMR
jgi:hypothetical protein